jgi:hypothetical protein
MQNESLLCKSDLRILNGNTAGEGDTPYAQVKIPHQDLK